MPVAAGTPVVNVAAPTFKANPWSICAELRAERPVVRVPMPGGLREGYLITRYEDAIRVLRDDEHFVKASAVPVIPATWVSRGSRRYSGRSATQCSTATALSIVA